ncbi:uncharacterized protein [Oryza sativa Japonica Group]|uniref:uncharacterized protein isoform X2 n=1 Tax=Oryza sativa subsp. japonica TaxID=39947 RepID=UPI000E1B8C6D|nr:wiskott-Aldrich syndrome protein family member 2-like isoform X3 [Oryza sativa Japonica Group]KAF2926737.1 hypothetical protein DAI22_06g152400 [Oryza sativa Japonica Group]
MPDNRAPLSTLAPDLSAPPPRARPPEPRAASPSLPPAGAARLVRSRRRNSARARLRSLRRRLPPEPLASCEPAAAPPLARVSPPPPPAGAALLPASPPSPVSSVPHPISVPACRRLLLLLTRPHYSTVLPASLLAPLSGPSALAASRPRRFVPPVPDGCRSGFLDIILESDLVQCFKGVYLILMTRSGS